MDWYARFVVRYPYVLIIVDVVLALLSGPLTVWKYGVPDFSDPIKGFEARGTKLSGRNFAAARTLEQLRDGHLSYSPDGAAASSESVERKKRDTHHQESCQHLNLGELANLGKMPRGATYQQHVQRRKRTASKQQFCAELYSDELANMDEMPRMVVKSKNNDTLLQARHIHSICDIEQEFIYSYWPDHHCNVPSLGRYIAALKDKLCQEITDEDIAEVLDDIEEYAKYYFNGELTHNCKETNACPRLPTKCTKYNAIYLILNGFSDVDFMRNGNTTFTNLTYSTIFIPQNLYKDIHSLTAYFIEILDGKNIQKGEVIVPAMNFHIKHEIVPIYQIQDLPLFVIAATLLILILLVYLQSFVLMITVILNVGFSFCIAYFLYFVVFQITFFPFINLFSALLLIAVGADDVFILYDLWRKHLREEPEAKLEKLLSKTLHHGIVSILMTSLTTAAALMANLIGDITSLKCFGVFAGLCIIVTFGLMITWVPAVIVIIEKSRRCFSTKSCPKRQTCNAKIVTASIKFWGEIMFKMITKVGPLWIILFLGLGAAGLVVILYKPGLSLPSSHEYQYLLKNHPFEKYQDYRDKFRFEKDKNTAQQLTMQAVWGLEGKDNGDHLDPDKRGGLIYKPFDLYAPESQEWMLTFCTSLKNQPFVSPQITSQTCFMGLVKTLIEGPCIVYKEYNAPRDHGDGSDHSAPVNRSDIELLLDPCCEKSFPIDAQLAEMCIKKYTLYVLNGYFIGGNNIIGHILYDSSGDLKVFHMPFHTKQYMTASYKLMEKLESELDDFMEASMASAPQTLDGGWMCGFYGYEFRFYDFQKSLASDTISGIGVVLAVAFVVLLITSLNIVTTVYAIVTIALIVSLTIAALILLGWELNIIESFAITISSGLSVDFTIHYGVAYKFAGHSSRRERVKHVLETVGSAVTMGALTTFIAGAAVMPGKLLSFRQFGTFLMILMTVSWVLSTFFFLAVFSVIGPLGNIGDLFYCVKVAHKKCLGAKKGQYSFEGKGIKESKPPETVVESTDTRL